MAIELWCLVLRYNFEIPENPGFFNTVYVDAWKRSGWWKLGSEIENCSYGCHVDYAPDVNVTQFHRHVLTRVKPSYRLAGYLSHLTDGLVSSDVGIIIFESYADFPALDLFRDEGFQ